LLVTALVFAVTLTVRSATVAAPDNAMVVDGNFTIATADPFDVEIDITAGGEVYQGYQFMLQWDPAILSYVDSAPLMPAGLDLCAEPSVVSAMVLVGCLNASGPVSFEGAVHAVTFRCLAVGSSTLHLKTQAEDPIYGSATLGDTGLMPTSLTDATVTCQTGGPPPPPSPTIPPAPSPTSVTPGPTPTQGQAPTATPLPPGATPTPLPPGFEAVDLTGGCNPVTTTYPDATPIGTIATAVGPAGNLEALWELEGGIWLGYSPAYPQASDLTAKDFLDVVFICVMGPGQFARPIV